MTPQRLADALETLANGPPWDTAWLRSLLPELAVRGRLVGQDPADTPVLKVLASARRDLAKMAASTGRLRWKESPVEEVRQPSRPGWGGCRLNDTGLYVNGLAFNQAKWADDGLPIIRIQNLSGSGRQFNYATGEYPREVMVDPGDLLVSWSATLDAYLWNGPRGVLNQHIFRVEENRSLVCRGFLYLLLKCVIREMAASDHAHGLAMKHINRGPFLAHAVEIPPLPEQHRIVAKVDELMGHAAVLEERHRAATSARVRLRDAALHALAEAEDHDAVETAWQRIEEHFEDLFTEPEDVAPLRQAVLQLAVRGRLLPSDQRCDWVEITLAKVLAEDLANGWSPKTVAYETTLRSLKLSATTSGVFRPCQFKYIDATLPAESGYWLRDGDLLVQRSNTPDLVGVSAVYRGEANQFIYPDLMIRCRLAPEKALPEFVHLALRDLHARGYFRERASGTSGSMVKINQTTLGATPIALPPLAEQHRIVAKVDELMALCDTLEASLTRAKTAREQFAASISAALEADPT